MASVRHDRIQELIKELASNIILFRLKDPRLGFVTITKVDLSPDMRQAKVYYSVFGTEKDVKLTDAAIRHAKGHVQREVAKRLHVRFAPEIIFVFDESPRKSIELSHLIDKALAEDAERRKETGREEPAEPAPEGEEAKDKLKGLSDRIESKIAERLQKRSEPSAEPANPEETAETLEARADELQDRADSLREKAEELRETGKNDEADSLEERADELEDMIGDLQDTADQLQEDLQELTAEELADLLKHAGNLLQETGGVEDESDEQT